MPRARLTVDAPFRGVQLEEQRTLLDMTKSNDVLQFFTFQSQLFITYTHLRIL